jgi:hypothetical protein
MAGIGPVAAPPAHFTMVVSAAPSPFCSPIAPGGAFCGPTADPFLLLQSTLSCVERILQRSSGRPLRRTWIEFPYGEEEITLLEEEVIPAIQQCLQRVDAIDAALQEEQEARIAIEQLRQQLADDAEATGGLEELLPL